MLNKFLKLPRLADWILVTLLLFGLVYWLAPQQLGVVAYKSLLVTLACVLGYWIDRAYFRMMAQPMDAAMPRDCLGAARVVARALIFLGCVMAMAFGL